MPKLKIVSETFLVIFKEGNKTENAYKTKNCQLSFWRPEFKVLKDVFDRKEMSWRFSQTNF